MSADNTVNPLPPAECFTMFIKFLHQSPELRLGRTNIQKYEEKSTSASRNSTPSISFCLVGRLLFLHYNADLDSISVENLCTNTISELGDL
jgi:hypothetical protein